MRPPVPEDTPVREEGTPFHGTNPWSGPYLVAAILAGVLLIVAAIVVAAVWLGAA